MMYVYIGIVIFLLAAGGMVVWKYNSAIERAVEAEQRAVVAEEAVKAYETSYNNLQSKYKQLDASLAKKTASDVKIRKELSNVQEQLEALKRSTPSVQEWADTPVPEPVVKLLRNDVTPTNQADRGGAGANGANPANSGPTGGQVTIRPN